MADTSLNENRIGLLIWQTSNLWQSRLRNKISKYNISFNEYLIIETIYNLSKYLTDSLFLRFIRAFKTYHWTKDLYDLHFLKKN